MMERPYFSYPVAALAVGAVAAFSSLLQPTLGLASAALLFLLPVLFAAVRGGVGPGLFAALAAALAYNFFLLPPRFSFHIHSVENLVSALVLAAVAIVTSRLANQLKTREAEATARAEASDEAAQLSAILAADEPESALAKGLSWLSVRHGSLRLIAANALPERDAGFSSLDLAASAWALHNGDVTGHGTAIMPAADWTFFPLAPKRRFAAGIAALARPATGETRSEAQLAHLGQLVLLLGQASDRASLAHEQRERERLEAGERLRRAFLASLAHDFRTPLTVIAGRLAPLAASQPEVAEALAATRQLDRLMDDLIGAARLEDGSLSPTIESLDLIDVVGAACAAVDLPEGIALERHIPADLPFVRGDAVFLRHALINLIDNAGRHANARIVISAQSTGGDVQLSVSDDGRGIPEAEQERVFDRFTRLAGSDRAGGSGLGLAIVRGFAEAMGMTVSVNRAPSGGANLILTMPAARMGAEAGA